jgi:hypothetical protein
MKHSLLIVTLLIPEIIYCQDIEQTLEEGKKTIRQDPIAVSGSIGAASVIYKANGIQPRRDPFYWITNANLTFLLFNKISVPFNAVVTQQDKNYSHGLGKFSQPFNQFGISPKYKWLTIHAGYRSLEFSEYTLSGAVFLGAGAEVSPAKGWLSGTAFYGRFKKAIPNGGTEGVIVSLPAYQRMGGGAKLKVGTSTNHGELVFIQIKDDIFSIPFDTIIRETPRENKILSVNTKQAITQQFRFEGQIALSLLTKNLYGDNFMLEKYHFVNQIFDPKFSTQFNKAITASAEYTPDQLSFGLKYKRIDPDYKTLGAIFLTNDLEELSLNSSYSFPNNKINFQVAAGLQKNNLDNKQLLTSRRFINSTHISINLSPHFNINANYSNFSSNTLPVRNVFSDSIKFVQLTQNANFFTSYSVGENTKQIFSLLGAYQQSGGNREPESDFYNATGSYNIYFSDIGLGTNISFLYNQIGSNKRDINETFGPVFGLQKRLLKSRLRLCINTSFQNNLANHLLTNKDLNFNLQITYSLSTNQSLRMDCIYLERKAMRSGAQQFNETRIGLGYTYTFAAKSKIKLIKDSK